MSNVEIYLRAVMATVARQTFPPERLIKIVAPSGGKQRQCEAFNMCDGKTTQKEICDKLKLDAGNLSKAITRWVDEGVMVKVEAKNNMFPVHVYPIPTSLITKIGKKNAK